MGPALWAGRAFARNLRNQPAASPPFPSIGVVALGARDCGGYGADWVGSSRGALEGWGRDLAVLRGAPWPRGSPWAGGCGWVLHRTSSQPGRDHRTPTGLVLGRRRPGCGMRWPPARTAWRWTVIGWPPTATKPRRRGIAEPRAAIPWPSSATRPLGSGTPKAMRVLVASAIVSGGPSSGMASCRCGAGSGGP
jgi:hypothetical protein